MERISGHLRRFYLLRFKIICHMSLTPSLLNQTGLFVPVVPCSASYPLLPQFLPAPQSVRVSAICLHEFYLKNVPPGCHIQSPGFLLPSFFLYAFFAFSGAAPVLLPFWRLLNLMNVISDSVLNISQILHKVTAWSGFRPDIENLGLEGGVK